jgi:hypothetical protein
MKRVLPDCPAPRPAIRPESNSSAAHLRWGARFPPPLYYLGKTEAKLDADRLRYGDFFTLAQRARGLRFSVQPVHSHQEHGRHRDDVHGR